MHSGEPKFIIMNRNPSRFGLERNRIGKNECRLVIGLGGLVFCFQNCSDLLWEKIVLVIKKNFLRKLLNFENEGREPENFEITKTIYSNGKRSEPKIKQTSLHSNN